MVEHTLIIHHTATLLDSKRFYNGNYMELAVSSKAGPNNKYAVLKHKTGADPEYFYFSNEIDARAKYEEVHKEWLGY